jgi:hypothetical protein
MAARTTVSGMQPAPSGLDAVTTARGFLQPGVDVPVLPEGARHVVARHRAASALSCSVSTWRPPIDGVERLGGRRPLAGFLVIVLGLSWLLLSIPVLAFHGVIPGANLPVEVSRWRRRC